MNKYGSSIRTYVATTLLWDTSVDTVGSPAGLQTLNAPFPLSLFHTSKDLISSQPFNTNFPFGTKWKKSNNLNIKRIGLFSNFADGLVMSNTDARLVITLKSFILTHVTVEGNFQFTEGSNVVTGDFSNVPSDCNFLMDNTGNIYHIENKYSSAAYRISNFAFTTASSNTSVFTLALKGSFIYSSFPIVSLNTMFDTEVFFDNSVEIGISDIPVLIADLNIFGGTTFNFYTKTISTDFNTLPVNFDCVLEAEITPS